MRGDLQRVIVDRLRKDLAGASSRLGLFSAAIAAIVILLAALLLENPAGAQSLGERQRFGFVATASDWNSKFDVAQLGAGWYTTDPSLACRVAPEGMDRALILRVQAGYTLDPERLGMMVALYPGSTWLVGNEPDSVWQDNVWPEEYARIYHELYTFIKSRDPASLLAPGGIVQATPLRLEYLDRVLDEYATRYGSPMPVDVWNIHNAILNEVSCDYDPGNCWGADIPPGIEADFGEVRGLDDNDNMALFAEQIWAFRHWMADRGYGGHPLIVTEYGILMPDDFGFGVDRVNEFMSKTFTFMQSETDPTLGDPSDGGRLVQRWAWFSLDVQPWNPITGEGFNGNLFNPDTGSITAFGLNFASHTQGLPPLDYVDLIPGAFRVTPSSAPPSPTQTITRSIQVEIANVGTVDSGPFSVALSYDGPASGSLEATLDSVSGDASRWVSFTLTDLPLGVYDVSVWADSGSQVPESTECNNHADGTVLAPAASIFLPAVARKGSGSRSGPGAGVESKGPGSPIASRVGILGVDFQEYPVPTVNSYPAQIALDDQGRVWITERDGNRVASFDPLTEAWQEYSLPPEADKPWGLALDPAGDVWVAATATDQILRLQPPNTWKAFDIPTSQGEPWDVATSGVTVWFTERAGNKIGKLLPTSGEITEYEVPTPDSQPAYLAAHGDSVWFTESAADQLAKLYTPTGSFLERLRPQGSQPQDITVTSGGHPWFSEAGGNRIVQFNPTTNGWGLEVDVPTPASEPYGIAMEGVVAVWFTERTGSKLGRFSERFGVSEFPLPTAGSLPTDVVVDSAGCAWYTAPGANRIGRLCWSPSHSYLPLIEGNWDWMEGH